MTEGRGREVRIEHVAKRYGATEVLHDLSLTVGPGEFCTVLGASGSGKSTLLKIIAGFEPVARGRVLIDGRDMAGVPVERRNIGMVFQSYALFPHLDVQRNVGFGLAARGRPGREIARKVDEVLERVELRGLARRYPSELSGGQQQRVALARALAIDPDVLLMDEPLGALDGGLRQSIQLQLKALHRALGLTVIHVTHDREEALHLSDRLVIMEQGRIAQEGTPLEVYLEPKNAFVATFLGDCNVFPDGDGRMVAVRPEDMTLSAAPPGDPDAATVEAVLFLGRAQKILARQGERRVVAIAPCANGVCAFRAGDRVHYGYAPDAARPLSERVRIWEPRAVAGDG